MSRNTKKKKAKAAVAKRALRRGKARRKAGRPRQYAAIPIRLVARGQVEVMLMTSRGTGRWVIPKGWPMRHRTPAGTACREAYEEAGITGHLWSRRSIGT
jgi:8-oxo-dGTP pyrophosphatase MutT (NUDIX family)